MRKVGLKKQEDMFISKIFFMTLNINLNLTSISVKINKLKNYSLIFLLNKINFIGFIME